MARKFFGLSAAAMDRDVRDAQANAPMPQNPLTSTARPIASKPPRKVKTPKRRKLFRV